MAAAFIPGIGTGVAAVVTPITMLMSSETLRMIGWLALGFGGLLSIYIPMLPGLIWFAGITKWVCSLAEALIGAQLWAFSHLKEKGDEFASGAATRGYAYMINLLLRPALMVLGFIFGSGILIALGTFFLKFFFFPLMSNMAGNSMVGASSIAFVVIIFSVVMLGLAQSIFNTVLIDMQDRLTGWLGQQAESGANYFAAAAAANAIKGFRGPSGGGGGGAASGMAEKTAGAAKIARTAILKS